jgi:hypothetical protein
LRYARSKGEIKIMTTATAATPEQRAILKSRELDAALWRTTRAACGVYTVTGEHAEYTVRVDQAGYHCDCPAGEHGRSACWHRASTYRLRLAERTRRAASPAAVKRMTAKEELWG